MLRHLTIFTQILPRMGLAKFDEYDMSKSKYKASLLSAYMALKAESVVPRQTQVLFRESAWSELFS